jgi:predicted secreted protein
MEGERIMNNHRDFLLKIFDEDSNEYITIGACRSEKLVFSKEMVLNIEGLFRDDKSKELLLNNTKNICACFQLSFPNGDIYIADFLIRSHRLIGSFDGIDTFKLALVKQDKGEFIPFKKEA